LTATALACRLFAFENSRWPVSIDELRAYLPKAPADAWGPIGYVLVRHGLPNGGDRPLVYSRMNAEGNAKLAYPLAEPNYGFYTDLGGGRGKMHPGQFRDVTWWTPTEATKKGPVVQVLN